MNIAARAWAAGIIDGEGCILSYETVSGMALRVTVRMVHKPTIICLCEMFGGKPMRVKTTHRTAWQWMRAGQNAASVIRQVLPYMVTKREEGHLLLDLASEQRLRGGRPAPRTWQRARMWKMRALKRREWK
jgi:hypothetical protein